MDPIQSNRFPQLPPCLSRPWVTRSSSHAFRTSPVPRNTDGGVQGGADNEKYIHHHATLLSITRPTTLLALRILIIVTLALLAILAIVIVIVRRREIPTSECFQDELLHRVNVGSKGRVVPAASEENSPAI